MPPPTPVIPPIMVASSGCSLNSSALVGKESGSHQVNREQQMGGLGAQSKFHLSTIEGTPALEPERNRRKLHLPTMELLIMGG